MNLGIVGYGRMGHLVEEVALDRGHRILLRLDAEDNRDGCGVTRESFESIDVAIEFSQPDTVLTNITKLIALGVPTVVGTTGWYDHVDAVRTLVTERGGSFVYGTNFSLGMNLFFKLAEYAAELMAPWEDYDPFLVERHHRFKLDRPSGTAIKLEGLMRQPLGDRVPAPVSVRAGHIPGTHEVGFDSATDTIRLLHEARNRLGFATGAVIAAEKLCGRKGFFEFPELLFGET